jgi:iron complex outermembrane recepter protein
MHTFQCVRSRRQRSIIHYLLPIALAAALTTGVARAQTAGAGGDSVAVPQSAGNATASQSAGSSPALSQLQEVVVTGSLIRSPNYVAASPIVTVSSASLKASGQVDLEGSLNQLPEFQPSSGAFLGNGIAELNMYGLGTNRNLVLLDGHRLPPADAFGDVDLNLIPQSIISNVQTITGGASAVYGSDAMSGVVNIITLNHFEGVRADVQYGNSFESDYQTVTSSLDLGSGFANGRGHVLVSMAYTSMPDLTGAQRSYFINEIPSSYIGQGTYVPSANNLPNPAVVSGVFAGYGITQAISPSSPLGFNNDGTLFTETGALNYKGPTTGAYAISGGNVRMPVGQQYIVGLPLDRKSIFTKYDFELNPHVQAYGDVLYVSSEVEFSSGDSLTQFNVPTIPVTNPFIPTDLATILASRPDATAPFTYNARYVDFGQRVNDNTETTSEFLDGLRGDFGGGDWTWDAYASYDTTNILEQDLHAVIEPQVENLLDSPNGGTSLCAGGFDPFGLNNVESLSTACRNYMTATVSSYEKLSQLVTQGVVQGPLFKLPAGEVQLAVLADYRRNTYTFEPDEELALGNVEAVVGSSAESGAVGVKEAATQLNVPILHDLPLVRSLEFDGGYRLSDYNTTGNTNTYDGELKWRTVPSLMIRGGYQHAIRAPNVGELYSAPTGGQAGFGTPPQGGDPCDVRSPDRSGSSGANLATLCEATGVPANIIGSYIFPTTAAATVTTGNTSLTPETANTYNLGFVYTSRSDIPALSGLSSSIDYYNIKISNVISTIPGTTVLDNCYNLDGFNPNYSATNPYCELIHRDPATGQITTIDTPYENLGMLSTDGLDVEVDWNAALADLGLHRLPGRLLLQTNIGWSFGYKIQSLKTSPTLDYIGTIDSSTGDIYPHLRALTTLGYALGNVTASLRWHYIGAMDNISVVTSPANVIPGVAAYNLFDLVGTYDIDKDWNLRAGITNLFNRSAPPIPGEIAGVDASVYDVVGRSYYVGATVTF